MVNVSDLLADFQQMHREHWPYVWGAAQKGCVDCSGAFVYSYKRHGASIYHGSNRIARRYVVRLIPITEAQAAGLILPGMAAFKARAPGQSKYDLPGQYKKGGAYYSGDLNDYYHIGLVDEDTAWVLNAQGSKTGFVRSKIEDNWSHVALLSDVAYTHDDKREDDDEMSMAKVTGGALFLREQPKSGAAVVQRMENGTRVEVLETDGDWARVCVHQPEGWCMKKFLTEVEGR